MHALLRGWRRPMLPRPAPMDPEATPSVLPQSFLSELSGCHAHHGVSNALATLDFAEKACGTPTASDGWRCYEDRPGKRGWISEDAGGVSGPGGTLTFAVPMGSTKLTVAYLRSYDQRMGTARLWVDEDESSAIHLNGSWDSRTSQTDIRTERVAALCKASCLAKIPPRRRGGGGAAAAAASQPAHTLHVQRTGGVKFKLLLLEVC